jgi:glutathione S-transferase
MTVQLYYWPTIPGRGEFVRLALEYAGVRYVDVARAGGGADFDAVQALLDDPSVVTAPFAPPVLLTEEVCLAQTANILLYLGERHGLAPADTGGRLWTHQLQLTLADWLTEIHDSHHPLGPTLYYEDQQVEAGRRAEVFHEYRLPKYMQYFERVIHANPSTEGWLVGEGITYVDLSLFQLLDGLAHAFPTAMGWFEHGYPRMHALRDRVRALPAIADYLASDRRVAFNEDGIFRHYPAQDAPGPV